MSEVAKRGLAAEQAVQMTMLKADNDIDRAHEFADAVRGELAYVAGVGYLEWDGRRWAEVSDVVAFGKAQDWLADMASARFALIPGDNDKLRRFQSNGSIRATLEGAKPLLLVNAGDLDAHDDLVNVANGVLDLRTLELGRHDPALMFTKIIPIAYEPGATHPDWSRALKALTKAQRAYMQVRLGQALTGYQPDDDKVIINQGLGSAGKSLIMDSVRNAFGEYAVMAPNRLLVGNPNDHSTELMTVRGARLVTIEELPESHRVNSAALKTLAGTESITGRKVYRDNVTFKPKHALVVNTNHSLAVAEVDDGTMRRIEIMRFRYQYVTDPQHNFQRKVDRKLRARLRRGHGGRAEAVFAWLVEGARQWYAAGRVLSQAPAEVDADRRAWRDESDVILRFVNECLVVLPGEFTPATELYALFQAWMQTQGQQSPGLRVFNERLESHGELVGRVSRGTVRVGGRPTKGWKGVALNDIAEARVREARLITGLNYPTPSTISITD